MKIKFLPVTLLFLILIINSTLGKSKAGTSAAQFLKIGVGARAVGMGESFVAVSNDALALYWNPAGLTYSEGPALTATHSEWFAGLYHDFVGFTLPIGNRALGVSLTSLNTDKIEITTIQEPEGTGIYYDATDVAIGLSYAHRLFDRFSVGITGKYLQQKIYNESASTLAFDIGTILNTGFHGLKIGMCLSNFGGNMKLDGSDIIVPFNVGGNVAITPDREAKLSTEEWPLPTNFRVGIAIDLMGAAGRSLMTSESSRLTLAIDGNHPTDNEEQGNMGIEYSWRDRVAVRMGYKLNYSEENLTLGGGINYGFGGATIAIDYAWADFGNLDYVHRFTLGFVF